MQEIKEKLLKDSSHAYEKLIVDGMCDIAKEDAQFLDVLKSTGRTMKQCFEYIKGLAQKQAKNGCAAVEDNEVYKWAKKFFEMPEEEYKKITETKKKVALTKNDVKEEKSNKPDHEDSVEEKEKPIETVKPKAPNRNPIPQKEKSKPDDLEGQMDIFSFLG